MARHCADRWVRRLLTAVLPLLVLAAGWNSRHAASDPPPPDAPLRVLFVGNSFTFYNDLPGVLSALVKESGQKRGIEVASRTVPGARLKDHWERGAAATIRGSRWDYVVLQEQSMTPLATVGRDDLFYPFARKLGEVILAEGAVPLFYMTWKRPGAKEDQREWTDSYLGIARELKAQVCPAGMAVEDVLAKKRDFPFHADGIGHPTKEGTYLVACTFFATIYGVSPVGLPASVTTAGGDRVGVAEGDAKLVQTAAWDAREAAKRALEEEKK